MKKFYSVTYSGLFEGLKTAWFTDKTKATSFSNQDYHDPVRAHKISRNQAINLYNQMVLETEYELSQLS